MVDRIFKGIVTPRPVDTPLEKRGMENLFFFLAVGKGEWEKLFCKLDFGVGFSSLQMCFCHKHWTIHLFHKKCCKNITFRYSNVIYRRKNIVYRHKNILFRCKNIVYRRSNINYRRANINYRHENRKKTALFGQPL